jgi:hypothetical protein
MKPMTNAEWKGFHAELMRRKNLLEWELDNKDFSQLESIIVSKREQLAAIEFLDAQVPYEIRTDAK